MSSILLTGKNQESLTKLINLAQKLNIKVSTVTEDEVLDLGLARAMEEVDNDDYVDISNVLAELRK